MLFQFFYSLNVNFQLLFSQFNYKAYRYNDVGLKKHTQISVTWFDKQYKKVQYAFKVTCFSSNIMERNSSSDLYEHNLKPIF